MRQVVKRLHAFGDVIRRKELVPGEFHGEPTLYCAPSVNHESNDHASGRRIHDL